MTKDVIMRGTGNRLWLAAGLVAVLGWPGVAVAATITGTVTFAGKAPALKPLAMEAEAVCHKKHGGKPAPNEALISAPGQRGFEGEVSAFDNVMLNLLQELKESLGMSYLFVSHDLNVVRLLCDRVIVMRAGRIVEQGPSERVLSAPEAQYTRDLLEAIPHPTFDQVA